MLDWIILVSFRFNSVAEFNASTTLLYSSIETTSPVVPNTLSRAGSAVEGMLVMPFSQF